MSDLAYTKAGVNIDEGDRFVRLISPMVKKTFRKEVMTDIGSFGGLFKLDTARYKDPVLVSGTDGVGTKLKVAFMADKHDTVGIDLVAMCVNDILVSGAEPLFFLDYFATGKLSPEKASVVVSGIVQGCQESGCALIGGETAEMPGFYEEGEYDLAGFAVGVVDRPKIIDGSTIKPGDVLIGIASSGLHSNGYSLVRKVLFEQHKMKVSDHIPELGASLGEVLLRPTVLYVKGIQALLQAGVEIKGMAHITGGGIDGNLPRCLPDGIGAELKRGSWPVPPIFELLKTAGDLQPIDLQRTFNMGLGYVIVANSKDDKKILEILVQKGYHPYIIGNTVERRDKVDERVYYV